MKIIARLLLLLVLPLVSRAQNYDVIIRHGLIVDGSGNPGYHADVAVKDGRIAAIGRIGGAAKEEIDATGLVVAPGFIDVHTHADDVANFPAAENFLRMGVTSIVVGNCGDSALDISKLFAGIEQKHVALNVASLVGHNSVREKAMGGSFDREPTLAEREKMKAIVHQAMADGAVGLSTGLIYRPGTFSSSDEIVELAKEIAPFDGIYTSHMRHEDWQIDSALNEVFNVARTAHVRAEISHIKLTGDRAWGQADRILGRIESARAEGLDITQDQYPYTASSTTLSQLIPDRAFDGGKKKFETLLADPAEKAKLVAEMKEKVHDRGGTNYAYAVIAHYPHDPSLDGLSIVAAAQKLHGSDSLDAQIETILDIEHNGSGQGVFHGMNEDDLQIFMRHPNTMIISDSGIREFGKGMPHPRGYGSNARILGHYVRELKVLRLEDAVRKMTSLPANTFQLSDRGQLRAGWVADITIFDPAKVDSPATYEDPHHYAVGIPFVLVNGVTVIRNSADTGARPGQPLRHVAPGGKT
ncbi:MAG TPA: D-aminoacylase [Candidatus Acidoferrales bacterium]|jgi:N-acyl-D-amino-acid deacylase|nr:D-aminoacylase [Candidatus Acidoferrales bacterium]